MKNELERAIEWYQVALDSQRLVRRIMQANPEQIPLESRFATATVTETKKLLEQAEAELNDLTIVSLISIFEQLILTYLKTLIDQHTNVSAHLLMNEIKNYTMKQSERWHFVDILNLFKSIMGDSVVENVKQVYKYRNWVAHGRKKAKPINLDPITAFERLSEFIRQLPVKNF